MLFPLLISLLVVATLALFAIGGVLIHQERLERAERRAVTDDPMIVTLGEVITEVNEIDEIDGHALAKLQLELQARRLMAEIIG
ncbi:MAG: hypothetical protein OEZ14_06145 [Acidimicrobiia bacterium]|nr:hypothetical protein [Acidimicrobiia bacterium]MDH5520097.1 hypothetical protein [Acidimicrobiia bacterium]